MSDEAVEKFVALVRSNLHAKSDKAAEDHFNELLCQQFPVVAADLERDDRAEVAEECIGCA